MRRPNNRSSAFIALLFLVEGAIHCAPTGGFAHRKLLAQRARWSLLPRWRCDNRRSCPSRDAATWIVALRPAIARVGGAIGERPGARPPNSPRAARWSLSPPPKAMAAPPPVAP